MPHNTCNLITGDPGDPAIPSMPRSPGGPGGPSLPLSPRGPAGPWNKTQDHSCEKTDSANSCSLLLVLLPQVFIYICSLLLQVLAYFF
jgi:hypothetical protein